MKKLLIKSISLVLILIMSALMMFSCSDKLREFGDNIAYMLGHIGSQRSNFGFPEGWTGGFRQTNYGQIVEHWWVESYDELLVAIDKLKSHGSTFASEDVFLNTYEGDLFDVKYYIAIKHLNNDIEEIRFGDDPFDRYAENVEIGQWFFFDEVTIDEINYGYVKDYRGLGVRMLDYCYQKYYKENGVLLPDYYYSRIKEYSSYDSTYYSYLIKIYSSAESELLVSIREYPDYLTTGDGLPEMNEDVINAIFLNTRRISLTE